MADDKQYSESEHLAILEDRVNRETAEVTAERDQLKSEKAELESKLDVETAAKVAADKRAEDAEKALEDFKAEVAAKEEAAAKKGERLEKAREAAKHLDDDFFTDEARVTRIVAMSDEVFEGYVADLAATAKVAGNAGNGTVPRETAMQGSPAGGTEKVAPAGAGFLLRQYVAPATATKEG
jgi:hypothetical protein